MPHEATIRKRVFSKDSIGGSTHTPTVISTEVPCWQQQASANEISDYEKRGISIDTKIYFNQEFSFLSADDTERYEILITKRDGITVTDPTILEVRTKTGPDAGAGLGSPFKVMANSTPSEIQ